MIRNYFEQKKDLYEYYYRVGRSSMLSSPLCLLLSVKTAVVVGIIVAQTATILLIDVNIGLFCTGNGCPLAASCWFLLFLNNVLY